MSRRHDNDESASDRAHIAGRDLDQRERAIGQASTGVRTRGTDVQLTPVSWIPALRMDENRWIEYGKRLGRAGNGTSWWLGDWLRYGSVRFGEKYALAARITGYDVQTLMNYAYVAAHVATRQRRPDVSWSHHAEVAKLDHRMQAAWLDRAVRQRLSVKDLRLMLRGASSSPDVPRSPEVQAATAYAVCSKCGQPLPQARTLVQFSRLTPSVDHS